MERVFKHYHPRQIAKFVKILFKGSFSIAGIGMFYFEQGKVLLPDIKNKEMLEVMKEVNAIIDSLSGFAA
ncbi:DUF1107 domain-containing protein [Vibrio nigripulchritudo]|uniref:DUF1107 domain-containing protein n=1 Tax=Vibrio nigripulchritudo TaxID=28173 RepID=UPI002492BE9F|nr:DUF1107 domain-containing protein [Vibrio nigripulchritudo]BDU35898.1 hypothetical protein TUMSATVNIG2_03670 [Vibrio nigripulchritudo]BDU41569.1 hypothetical protein TUMSATVNIG3_03670 [Vibrio nigripulchritudo]